MMIFDKFSILRGLFGRPLPPMASIEEARAAVTEAEAAAVDPSRRWRQAANRDPELLGDVLRLGGILTTQPIAGGELAAPIDPLRLAYETGRRDLALQLATMMSLSIHDLNTLMEDNDATA